jgi:tRNA A-37 threonylcarbamoyl transferase component Bud32
MSFITKALKNNTVVINKSYEYLMEDLRLSELTSINKSFKSSEEYSFNEGRGKIAKIKISESEAIVMREYLRGGIIKRVLSKHFFHLPYSSLESTRPVRELSILSKLSNAGVLVPEPVFAVVQYAHFFPIYSGIIGTREIKDASNLLDLVKRYKNKEIDIQEPLHENIRRISYLAGKEANSMIRERVMHIDLHLGNILFADNKAYLIDFDKSFEINGKQSSKYFDLLIRRWKKSAYKHEVQDIVVIPFLDGLGVGG